MSRKSTASRSERHQGIKSAVDALRGAMNTASVAVGKLTPESSPTEVSDALSDLQKAINDLDAAYSVKVASE